MNDANAVMPNFRISFAVAQNHPADGHEELCLFIDIPEETVIEAMLLRGIDPERIDARRSRMDHKIQAKEHNDTIQVSDSEREARHQRFLKSSEMSETERQMVQGTRRGINLAIRALYEKAGAGKYLLPETSVRDSGGVQRLGVGTFCQHTAVIDDRRIPGVVRHMFGLMENSGIKTHAALQASDIDTSATDLESLPQSYAEFEKLLTESIRQKISPVAENQLSANTKSR